MSHKAGPGLTGYLQLRVSQNVSHKAVIKVSTGISHLKAHLGVAPLWAHSCGHGQASGLCWLLAGDMSSSPRGPLQKAPHNLAVVLPQSEQMREREKAPRQKP